MPTRDDAEDPGAAEAVVVEVRAHAFERFGRPLAGAAISFVERPGLELRSGRDGTILVDARVGERLTARLHRPGYQSIQTATVVVPPGGLVGGARAISLQVPLGLTVRALQRLLARPRPGRHHLVTTIAAAGKTLADSPQGEPGARVVLGRLGGDALGEDDPGDLGDAPIYLGALPLIHKTDFARAVLAAHGLAAPRRSTSVDGGVMIANVPRGTYRLGAVKAGVEFSSAVVEIRACSPLLINVSPPQGPRVIGPRVIGPLDGGGG